MRWFYLLCSTLTVGIVWAALRSCWPLPGPVEGEPLVDLLPLGYCSSSTVCTCRHFTTSHITHHTHITLASHHTRHTSHITHITSHTHHTRITSHIHAHAHTPHTPHTLYITAHMHMHSFDPTRLLLSLGADVRAVDSNNYTGTAYVRQTPTHTPSHTHANVI